MRISDWSSDVCSSDLARFRSAFLACTARPCTAGTTSVAAGTRMPGVPANYGSLRLRHGGELGWHQSLDLTAVGAVSVNDTDTEHAAGYGVIGVDAGYTFAVDKDTHLLLSARVDHPGDRRYVGPGIVNDSNGP